MTKRSMEDIFYDEAQYKPPKRPTDELDSDWTSGIVMEDFPTVINDLEDEDYANVIRVILDDNEVYYATKEAKQE